MAISRSERSLILDGASLNPRSLESFTRTSSTSASIRKTTLKKMSASHDLLLRESKSTPIYGVNTGFGPMVSHIIDPTKLSELQYNLVRGHSVGAGDPVPDRFVLAAMVVRLNTIIKGYSGSSPQLAETLCAMINHRITPLVPEHGAVGTSGDLVQLAHIALGIIGEGEGTHEGKRSQIAALFKTKHIQPHVLRPKEGLSLINGTSMMSAITALLVCDAERLLNIAVRSAALSFELVHAFSDVLDPVLHSVRPHKGQQAIAKIMRDLLKDSRLLRERTHDISEVQLDRTHETTILLQEVYSLRCTPQILGPIYETLLRTSDVVTTEINSVTDNPIVDSASKRFLHGGNFHGDYIAVSVDQLKAAMTKLSILSERRTNFFLNKAINRTFPPFLNLKEPGVTMGLQGLQFVATSTTAHSQTLSYPHSLHSIPTNGDNQDVVSMGCDAALIAHVVIKNAYIVLGIELIALSQAADYLKVDRKLSRSSKLLIAEVRKSVAAIRNDRSLYSEMTRLTEAMSQGDFDYVNFS